jgi:hypothetical protein
MRLGPAFLVAAAAILVIPDLAHRSVGLKSASASTFIEMTVADLVAKSTLVVAGTPLESTSLWEDSEGGRGRRIVTYTRLRIDRTVDGDTQPEVWVRTLGGHVGDIGQHVDGEAVLVTSRPGLFFLRAIAGGTHAVVGMSQGHYPLEAEPGSASLRLRTPQGLGRLVEKLGSAQPSDRPPARAELVGRTLDDVAQLVAAERRAHAR